ncbi:hypothetical protein T12_13455 [Trichinella patagoniensis]|uniref:Uncharacterized protein n=1 Tax=Trichinella patagoniensis TaxID=990121 RepID=A0A0V0ZKU2_9BILA|nr:hypothetical protein T12_8404 [Trichinella patagoniensis]KRY13208.1 hypothetical protein T12_13455 [Trichinella patagoniensis]
MFFIDYADSYHMHMRVFVRICRGIHHKQFCAYERLACFCEIRRKLRLCFGEFFRKLPGTFKEAVSDKETFGTNFM